MKKLIFILLIGFSYLQAQVGYSGTSNGQAITIDLSDTRFAFTQNDKVIVVKQTGNTPFTTTLSQFVSESCESYFLVTSKKKQGVLNKNQVFAINRAFVEKVLTITGGCTILTKDPAVSFDVSTSFADVRNAMTACPGGGGSITVENGLYDDGTVKLGGELTEDTEITGNGHYVSFYGTTGFSVVNLAEGQAASSQLVTSTNLGIPSTLTHTDLETGNYGTVSLDGDGTSILKSADDNEDWYAEVSTRYNNATINLTNYQEWGISSVMVAQDISISADEDARIWANNEIDLTPYQGSVVIQQIESNVPESEDGNDYPVLQLIAGSTLNAYATPSSSFLITSKLMNDDVIGNGNWVFGTGLALGGGDVEYNTAIGQGAMELPADGIVSNNVAMGHNALRTTANNSNYNVAIGEQSMYNVSGAYNVGLGFQAMYQQTGSSNIGIGEYSLYSTTGNGNIGVGIEAGAGIGSGADNIAIGTITLGSLSGGSKNIAIGYGSMSNSTTGNSNIGIGTNAMTTVTGMNNVGIGEESLHDVGNATENTAIGALALQLNTGIGNTGVGYSTGVAQTTGNYNTFIGYSAGSDGLDTYENATAIGYSSTVKCSDCFILGNPNVKVGIGTDGAVNPKAVLELKSTTKGFLVPRMNSEDADIMALGAGDAGMIVFVSDTNATFTTVGFWGWNGTSWSKF